MIANIHLANGECVTVGGLSKIRSYTSSGAGTKFTDVADVEKFDFNAAYSYSFIGEQSAAVFAANTVQYIEFKNN